LVKENLISLYLSGGLIYFYVYYTRKKSPILVFWDWVGFRSKEKAFVNSHFRDIINWFLHLVIAYAFGRTLLIFLRNNLNFILSLAWPDPDVFITGSLDLLYPGRIIELIKSSFSVVVYVVTHPPHFKSLEIFFWVLRYLLFSLTIVGCIIGYGHSILGYLWGKKIRNLDFTIMGWLVNAICYTPLLGNVIWQMVPSYAGPDPIITDGPLYIFLMIVDFLLNLLYTLSIWNLGKMFGVMTDKGVRTNGFYSVVRHPSYTLEGLMFMTLMMNGFSTLTQWFAASMGIFIYYVRSERDDNFMSNSNPQYLSYKEKTPFKFLPGIY
jgi:protein-S-isoprenylcysteine O-methyltransferase Ste14